MSAANAYPCLSYRSCDIHLCLQLLHSEGGTYAKGLGLGSVMVVGAVGVGGVTARLSRDLLRTEVAST